MQGARPRSALSSYGPGNRFYTDVLFAFNLKLMFECSQGEITVSKNNGRNQTSIRIIFVRPRKQVLHGHCYFFFFTSEINFSMFRAATPTTPGPPGLHSKYILMFTSPHIPLFMLRSCIYRWKRPPRSPATPNQSNQSPYFNNAPSNRPTSASSQTRRSMFSPRSRANTVSSCPVVFPTSSHPFQDFQSD